MFDDEVRRARFDELDLRGASTAEIAAEFGVCARTVERWRAAAGRPRQVSPVYPVEMRQRARDLVADGCSKTEAARTLGVALHTVARWTRDMPGWSPEESGHHGALMRWVRRTEAVRDAA